MSPSRRYLQGPFYVLLPFDIVEVSIINGVLSKEIFQVHTRGLERDLSIEEFDHLGQVLDPVHSDFLQYRGLWGICCGKDETLKPISLGSYGNR